MDIVVQKNTPVSLHQQIITQISMQIAAGLLKAGAKLPSIRALSQNLDLHHDTCLSAYQALETAGLIEIRHGSGVRVAIHGPSVKQGKWSSQPPVATSLETLADFFVKEALQQGHTWDVIAAALEKSRQALSMQGSHPLVIVHSHPDLLPIFQAELQDSLQRPVQGISLDQLNTVTDRFSHFLVSRFHYPALKKKLAASWEKLGLTVNQNLLDDHITVIEMGAIRQESELLRQLPSDSQVAICSVSTIILQQAEVMISALRGEALNIRTILVEPNFQESFNAETQAILKQSSVIFADWLCTPVLKRLTHLPIQTLRAIPAQEIDKLKAFQKSSASFNDL